jgi:lipopolysaccharide transport system ATP-binding protein
MSVVIEIEDLWKEYNLGVIGHDTLMRDLQSWWARVRGRPDPNSLLSSSESDNSERSFLALREINLSINEGDVVGIIGKNGAGKSTLLKILSRVTSPTRGTIRVRGRLASLLEVGTGFHPELTGRENVYLNGAILGMTRADVSKHFDEIIAFSGVEKFVDTPVKRYSSGMYVRLAFAVAAHLEPEILIVDEVLAVGDADFQRKCIGKMQDVRSSGRTILFVSHNMASIRALCSRGILLESGRMVFSSDSIEDTVMRYLAGFSETWEQRSFSESEAPGDSSIRLRSVRTVDEAGKSRSTFDVRESVSIEVEYEVLKPASQYTVSFQLLRLPETHILTSFDDYIKGPWGRQTPQARGIYTAKCTIPRDFLNNGDFSILLRFWTAPDTNHPIEVFDILRFRVTDSLMEGGVREQFPLRWGDPLVRPRLTWETTYRAT